MLIQLGSSQLPTKARENRIWPVSRPLEAAAVANRVRGAWGRGVAVSLALATLQSELTGHQPYTASSAHGDEGPYRERCTARLTSEWYAAVIALIGSSDEFAPLSKRLWG